MINRTKCAVLKDGKLLMANKRTGAARTFATRDKAKAFVANLIWVSNDLTPHNFQFIPVAE